MSVKFDDFERARCRSPRRLILRRTKGLNVLRAGSARGLGESLACHQAADGCGQAANALEVLIERIVPTCQAQLATTVEKLPVCRSQPPQFAAGADVNLVQCYLSLQEVSEHVIPIEQLRHRACSSATFAGGTWLGGLGADIVSRVNVRNQRAETLDATVRMRGHTARKQLIKLSAPNAGCGFNLR
ncbi:hypothetical protein [Trinickia soli]|uniref:hypothetical protein n=1 Tax=Trinickia soli TaxID=380675 RepID=UPI003FA364AA